MLSTRLTVPALLRGAHPDFGVALERGDELLGDAVTEDLDVFTTPTFDDEEVAELLLIWRLLRRPAGLISRDLFRKQDADCRSGLEFFGTTEEEYATLMVCC